MNRGCSSSKPHMGARMRRILEDLSKNGPSKMKCIIIRIEGIEKLPDREITKRLYSKTRSSVVRLMRLGFVERSEGIVYNITETGDTYIRNNLLKGRVNA